MKASFHYQRAFKGGNFCRAARLCGLAVTFCVAALSARGRATAEVEPVEHTKVGEPVTPHAFDQRTGALETQDGLTLRLNADLGSVHIVPLEAGAAPVLRYTVRIETDARAAQAQALLEKYVLRAKATGAGVEIEGALPPQAARAAASGAQFWVQFEIAVPAGYSLDVNTEAGDIETQDIGGTATLITQGGNIRTGRIGVGGMQNVGRHRMHEGNRDNSPQGSSKLRTEGGHIQVLDVMGNLNVFTGGGHINVGNVTGDAALRSGGGHIRAGTIGGRADLDTDGGNITVGHAGSFVNVRTGGGQIDFGEVRGSVHAQTGGGGIRIMYVAGPMEVESSGGSICLTRVAGAVQAATADGSITAWISPSSGPDGVLSGGPSGSPGNVSNHPATVQLAGASQLASGNGDIVVFLPRNLAVNIDALVAKGGEHRIEADPALHLTFQNAESNNAGPVHATGVLNGGGIPLKLRTSVGKIRLQFLDSDPSLRESRIREQQERLRVVEVAQPTPPDVPTPPQTEQQADSQRDWLERWMGKLEEWVTGGLREDADDFRNRLTYSPHPIYPELAQRVGIQGVVKLQVRVQKDGRVEVLKLVQGEPALAEAAIAAVKQWRGKPAWMNGKQVEVVSTVTFNFQLN
ncbi:MAG TPA: energy transducer TonB [Candidatus Acidoferrum sp.]|nr:energy transducer TonB [Candidatus Acidoferrum sp.]